MQCGWNRALEQASGVIWAVRTLVVAPAVALLGSVASAVTVPTLHAFEHVVRKVNVGRGRAGGGKCRMPHASVTLTLCNRHAA